MDHERTIVIGDVHGCLQELDELLLRLALRGRDRGDHLVFTGDLLDRGPDPVGVVRRVRELEADVVLGNHEEKHLRWKRWERKVASGEAPENPMRPFRGERLAQHNALDQADWDWMGAFKPLLRFTGRQGRPWIVVHAGFECNGTPVEDQKFDRVCRLRDVDKDGKYAVNKEDFFAQAPGAVAWAERWQGPECVVYGHAVHSLRGVRIDKHKAGTPEGYACYGIDTGCVFGGHLTALVISDSGVEIEQVAAQRVYYKPPANWRVGGPMSSED